VASCETSGLELVVEKLLQLERELGFDKVVRWPLYEASFELVD
jgi:hypothetical protein